MRKLAAAVLVILLAGCASQRPAPVTQREQPAAPPPAEAPAPAPEPAPPPKPIPTHTVKRGETLVSIALQYGLDYRELAAWNGITNPAKISVGQVLLLGAPPGMGTQESAPPTPIGTTPLAGAPPIEARPLGNTPTLKVEPRGQKMPYSDKALAQFAVPDAGAPASAGPATTGTPPAATTPGTPPATTEPVPAQPGPIPATPLVPAPVEPPRAAGTAKEDLDWMWPAKGKVAAPFSEASKGMDIAGKRGAPVVAAAAGRVIYADAGLRGYGKLVIIRHNDTWLSAYAHNDKILVKEQDEVKKGQKIAEMGSTDADQGQVALHFEIRRQGKPVDPVKVLPPM
jgi:lipoprotein NlpD